MPNFFKRYATLPIALIPVMLNFAGLISVRETYLMIGGTVIGYTVMLLEAYIQAKKELNDAGAILDSYSQSKKAQNDS